MIVAWEVYELARQSMAVAEATFAVGLIGLAHLLPLVALTLVAGETAERHDRRSLAVCFLAQLLTAAGLAGHAGGGLWPVFARDVLAVGPEGYAVLRAALAVGGWRWPAGWRCARSAPGPGRSCWLPWRCAG